MSNQNNSHISVVIPVHNAEKCLDELYRRLKAALEIVSSDFEIVPVEDCGGDNSYNFRIMSRKVTGNFRRMREQLRCCGGLVQWMGFPTTSDVEHARYCQK